MTEREKLTVHDDMVSLPEELLVLELRLGNGRRVFPIPPVGPVLSEVDTVPQLLGSERAMSEDEIIAALGERGRVVVGVREDHGIVLLALSEEEMVGSLIAQAGRSGQNRTPEILALEDDLPLFQLHFGSSDS
jgi:hypothetical protein